MISISAAEWLKVLTYSGVDFGTATAWAPGFAARVQSTAFSMGEAEIDDFVGQTLYETAMLRSLVEDLSYSVARLRAVWPKRFPDDASAAPYAMNPRALAEKVYGGRFGNASPGDGWKYRGRGVPMVTFRDNYASLAKSTGLDLLAQPDLLSTPDVALRCGIAWWEGHVPDMAIDDQSAVTRAVNGGETGLVDRARIVAKVGAALAAIGIQIQKH